MKKIRITVNVAIEYEPNVDNYPGCDTIEQMLALDIKAADEDPHIFMDSDQSKWTIAGEIVG